MGIAFCQGKGYWIATRALLLYLLFLRRLERLPLLHGKLVWFQQSSIALSACMCFPFVRVCVCVSSSALIGSPVVFSTI